MASRNRDIGASIYQRELERLMRSGADPRTASALAVQAYRAYNQRRYAQYRSLVSRGSSGASMFRTSAMSAGMTGGGMTRPGGGTVATITPQIAPKVTTSAELTAQKQEAEARQAEKAKQEQIQNEISLQPGIQKRRAKRQSMLRLETQALRRRTGRRALLESRPGGVGFFGGYFKG